MKKTITLDELGEDIIKSLEQLSPEEREKLRQQMDDELDCVTSYLIRNKIPLTQKNWLELAYLGEKSSVEELGPEEQADLPETFEHWPATELQVN